MAVLSFVMLVKSSAPAKKIELGAELFTNITKESTAINKIPSAMG
jgi:hypothetical protein